MVKMVWIDNIEQDNEKRQGGFECTRAIGMLWIVSIWHCRDYISRFPWTLELPIFTDITNGVLATFVFISGYFLGKKKFLNCYDIGEFYKRRFFHLYCPFFLSCLLMLILHYLYDAPYIASIQQFLLSLAGLSLLIPPAPWTTWFVVFIIPCYLMTPFLVRSKYRVQTCIFTYAFVVVIQNVLKNYFGINSDERILEYLPIFLVALCLPYTIDTAFNMKKLLLSILLVFLLEILEVHFDSEYKYVLFTLFIIVFLEMGKLINQCMLLKRIGMMMSSISMLSYLFHRQYLYIMKMILGDINMICMYLIILPFFFIMLYMKKKKKKRLRLL